MLTKEQEQAIRDAIRKAFDVLRPETVDAIVAAVKKYDELQNTGCKGFFDTISTIEEKLKNDEEGTDTLVAFKANRKDKIRLFNSVAHMLAALTLENNCHVAICNKVSDDYEDIALPQPQWIYKVTVGEDGMHIGEPIGYCDCKTFKKG